jgi:hypothetical protein
MTVEVAGIWEQGWSVPITESNQWEVVLREFGVERLNMTPASGIVRSWVHEYPSIEELLEDRKHLSTVFVDESAEVELSEFEHPKDALYVFGRVSYSPLGVTEGESLKIGTPKPGMMWPHQALAVVLYDRGLK